MIPDYETLMRPVLNAGANGEIAIAEVVKILEIEFALTDAEIRERLPSGKQARFSNRVNWAKSYLKQSGLIENTKWGYFTITDSGQEALKSGATINKRFLVRYEGYQEFKARAGGDVSASNEMSEITDTPDETLRNSFQQINTALAAELLDRLKSGDPSFFEKSIIDLLLKMGYGATEQSGKVVGSAGDDGVDGVINQDALGVDQVYMQAKRYKADNKVGPSAIRDFYGALSLKDVTKGIFVTTSSFTNSARDTSEKLGARIVLIDGVALAELLIRYEIGCRIEETFHISRLDDGYFE